jgi:hypothetical protein
MKTCILALFLMAVLPMPLSAKNNDWPKVIDDCNQVFKPKPPPAGVPSTPLWKRSMGCGIDFFTARPVHLTIKSVVPGGGFGPGLTSHVDFNSDRWQRYFETTGVSSFQAFWEGSGKFSATHQRFGANNSARDRFAFEAYSFARGLPHMDFYGLGPNTFKSNVVAFTERDIVGGIDVFNPFSSWLAAGARLEGIWPQVGGVTDPKFRSITSVFNETTAPGLISQPTFLHYEGYLEPRRARHKFQFKYDVGYSLYQDTDTGHFSFRRFKVDGTHPFHPFRGRLEDVLTIHDHLSISQTSDSNVVPFYMQETLGGSDINGQPTLRGFADYRFRAPNLVLFQVEYDHRFWGPVGALLFYDTGQVANRPADLNLGRMRHSFGFGLSFWAAEKQWFKIYVGLGSGEGVHPYFGIPRI